jgi:redox-sensitive bicupin YhaK (pirin superfamily)
MKTRLIKEETRGHANHGWLNAKHSFSFASWYNPEKIHFGVLRVLNDDIIAAKMGFSTHPHDNMEIITIPLTGALAHKDSMGNSSTIQAGEIQVMSAGSGVEHSEFNPLKDQETNLFQIWLFPNKRNVEPRYDQQKIEVADHPNELVQILSPNQNEAGVWIHQDAWFHMGEFLNDTTLTYSLKKPDNGLYIMQIEGVSEIEGNTLNRRDALEVENANEITINMKANSSILVMEVPMK